MCILFVLTDPKPEKGRYRMILATNRDEYYIRPAENLHMIADNVLGGQDMEPGREGGMWLGASSKRISDCKFRIGALLNVSGEDRETGAKDRGPIVTDYLKGSQTAEEYVQFMRDSGKYKPHNFVSVELSEAASTVYHSSNVPMSLHKFPGKHVLGFGNSPVGAALTKVSMGLERFKRIVEDINDVEKKDELVQKLLDLLKWDEKHLPDIELEKRNPQVFESLSSVFVHILPAGYGTRAHSIVLVDHDWTMEFLEIAMEQPINKENPTWIANKLEIAL